MKAVVTGAAGFLGSHLCDSLLADSWSVVGVDAFVDYYPRAVKERALARACRQPAFRLVEGALEDLELAPILAGADVVFHLAAQAGVRASWGADFARYTSHNVLATQRLLESALASGRQRVVYASSSSVYGDSQALPLREDSPCHPISPYGVTKLAAEHLCRLYHRTHALPVVSLRYFTAYGPRQRPDMAFHRFLSAARDGQPLRLFGDGEQTRDFTYVDDVIAATRAAAAGGQPGAVYNVGGGERVRLNAVVELIQEVTGRTLAVERGPAQAGDMRDTFADTTAAARDLGFKSRVPLGEGLAREWAWLKESA